MDGQAEFFGSGPICYQLKETAADGVRSMGRDPDPKPHARPIPQFHHPGSELSETLLRLIRVGSEHFLVGDARCTGFGQRNRYRAGISRIGDGRYPCGIAVREALPGCIQILFCCPGCLQLAQLPDPGRKLGLLNSVSEAGELKMGMGVDETGENGGIFPAMAGNTFGPGHGVIAANLLKASVGANQDGSALDGVTFDWNQPACGQSPRQ